MLNVALVRWSWTVYVKCCSCLCFSKNWYALLLNVTLNFSSSSSSGATASTFERFVPLNISFPLITILDAANPIPYFPFLHVISYVIFPSVLWSPLWSYWHWFPFIYFFFTLLSSGIRCKRPNQLNRCAFMWFIVFLRLINSSNSSFVLILHVPSLSFVGSKIFLTLSYSLSFPTYLFSLCL